MQHPHELQHVQEHALRSSLELPSSVRSSFDFPASLDEAPSKRRSASKRTDTAASSPLEALLTSLGERLESRLAEQGRQLEEILSTQEQLFLTSSSLQRPGTRGASFSVPVFPSSAPSASSNGGGAEQHSQPSILRRLFASRGPAHTTVSNVSSTSFRGQLRGQIRSSTSLTMHSPKRNFANPHRTPQSEQNFAAPGCRRRLAAVISSTQFDFFMGCMIVLNAFLIALQADGLAKDPLEKEPIHFRVMGGLFCWLFVLELLLRLVGFGCWSFFFGEDWKWNVFDTVVVVSGVAEEIISFVSANVSSNMTVLRIMRILKLTRVMRVVRVIAFFRELRIMMMSMVASLRSLTWTLTLLSMVMFSFAVYITTAVAEAVAQGEIPQDTVGMFGSMSQTMLLLFQAITGGLDWSSITDVLSQVSSFAVAVFLSYIAFVLFAVMNIMTGFFVEQAMKAADADLEHVISEQTAERERIAKHLRDVFHFEGSQKTNTVSWGQLKEHLKDPAIQVYFKTLSLELTDLHSFFSLIANQQEPDPTVNVDEFVRCCLRLKGPAKNADVVVLRHQLEKLTAMVQQVKQQDKRASSSVLPQQ